MEATPMRYAVVTPVRNELSNLRRVSASLAGQSVRPACWVIVDTGSTDGTVDLARSLAGEHAWIEFLSQPTATSTKRGGPIVPAFGTGSGALGGPSAGR